MGSVAVGELNKMLDALTGRTTYTANAAVWARLHTGDPGSAGTNNNATLAARRQVTFGSAASGGSISNTADVTWTNVNTAETYTHISFWTASSGGTFLGSDDLPSSRAVNVGDTFTIPSGSLTISAT